MAGGLANRRQPHGVTVILEAIVVTKRLVLIPWTSKLIDGFLTRDRTPAEWALGIIFPEPFGPPPEKGDVLDYFRAMVAANTAGGAFVPRPVVRKADRMAVGCIGLGAPDEAGVSTFGYSVHPQFEGRRSASEAAAALVDRGMKLPDVTAIRATIPLGHTASELVSSRAGLTMIGEQIEDEREGLLNV